MFLNWHPDHMKLNIIHQLFRFLMRKGLEELKPLLTLIVDGEESWRT